MKRNRELLKLVKRIQALSEIGQNYAMSDYDLDRYNELEQISLEMTSLLTDADIEKIRLEITDKEGYKTPKVDVRAVVFNEREEILMIREEIDGKWSLPGGWADIGYTPAEVAVKETAEEAGIKVEARKLLAVLDKKCHEHPEDVHYVYKIFIECKILSNLLNPGFEASDAGYFALDSLPNLSLPRNTRKQIAMMFAFKKGEMSWPYIDL